MKKNKIIKMKKRIAIMKTTKKSNKRNTNLEMALKL